MRKDSRADKHIGVTPSAYNKHTSFPWLRYVDTSDYQQPKRTRVRCSESYLTNHFCFISRTDKLVSSWQLKYKVCTFENSSSMFYIQPLRSRVNCGKYVKRLHLYLTRARLFYSWTEDLPDFSEERVFLWTRKLSQWWQHHLPVRDDT